MYNPKNIKEETRVIFQDRTINFRLLNKEAVDHKDKYKQLEHIDGLLKLKPGKIIHIRLYTSTAGITIDGYELEDVNKQFLSGNTNFVILENSGKFAAGNVNYLTFECIEITNQAGITTQEVKVRINVLQEKAMGHTSGMTDWAPNTYYSIHDDVFGPDNRLYNCTVAHTSTTSFDNTKWERQGGIDQQDADDWIEALGTGSFDSYSPEEY
jgi:hypothetical protein|tara:strand:+ start:169 stop:801 length:633 start_codon:yes stop_codon:yes gene_type:complete